MLNDVPKLLRVSLSFANQDHMITFLFSETAIRTAEMIFVLLAFVLGSQTEYLVEATFGMPIIAPIARPIGLHLGPPRPLIGPPLPGPFQLMPGVFPPKHLKIIGPLRHHMLKKKMMLRRKFSPKLLPRKPRPLPPKLLRGKMLRPRLKKPLPIKPRFIIFRKKAPLPPPKVPLAPPKGPLPPPKVPFRPPNTMIAGIAGFPRVRARGPTAVPPPGRPRPLPRHLLGPDMRGSYSGHVAPISGRYRGLPPVVSRPAPLPGRFTPGWRMRPPLREVVDSSNRVPLRGNNLDPANGHSGATGPDPALGGGAVPVEFGGGGPGAGGNRLAGEPIPPDVAGPGMPPEPIQNMGPPANIKVPPYMVDPVPEPGNPINRVVDLTNVNVQPLPPMPPVSHRPSEPAPHFEAGGNPLGGTFIDLTSINPADALGNMGPGVGQPPLGQEGHLGGPAGPYNVYNDPALRILAADLARRTSPRARAAQAAADVRAFAMAEQQVASMDRHARLMEAEIARIDAANRARHGNRSGLPPLPPPGHGPQPGGPPPEGPNAHPGNGPPPEGPAAPPAEGPGAGGPPGPGGHGLPAGPPGGPPRSEAQIEAMVSQLEAQASMPNAAGGAPHPPGGPAAGTEPLPGMPPGPPAEAGPFAAAHAVAAQAAAANVNAVNAAAAAAGTHPAAGPGHGPPPPDHPGAGGPPAGHVQTTSMNALDPSILQGDVLVIDGSGNPVPGSAAQNALSSVVDLTGTQSGIPGPQNGQVDVVTLDNAAYAKLEKAIASGQKIDAHFLDSIIGGGPGGGGGGGQQGGASGGGAPPEIYILDVPPGGEAPGHGQGQGPGEAPGGGHSPRQVSIPQAHSVIDQPGGQHEAPPGAGHAVGTVGEPVGSISIGNNMGHEVVGLFSVPNEQLGHVPASVSSIPESIGSRMGGNSPPGHSSHRAHCKCSSFLISLFIINLTPLCS